MSTALPWSTAFRIAWREMHASRAKFLFVIVAVAVGVGSLTGVRGFSRSFRRMLLRDARTLMAADLSARVFGVPTAEQQAVFDNLAARGVRRTWITETVTMASSAANPDPLLVSVKAVDPSAYPFYGEVQLSPPHALRDALNAQTVVVTDDLLLRLNVKAGDTLRIGGQDFRIAGVIVSEPDRMTGTLNVGPRVMITREGLDRTGLISLGSRASERFLFRLPATGTPSAVEVRHILKSALPEATIADYTETHPIITRGLDRSTTFLSLIGLIALVIGAMGVGSAMHSHLQQRLDSIAVMKCVGGRSGQVIRIYTVQTLLLGLGGGLLGVVLGTAVSAVFPSLLAQYFTIPATAVVDAWPALQGVAIACLVTLLFTLPPLLGIRAIRPAKIFRRDMEPEVTARHRRWFSSETRPALLAGAAILIGTGLVAATLTDGGLRLALRTGMYFTLALAAGVAALSAAAWLLLRAVRLFLRHAPARLPSTLRQGIANLYRPGNQAQAAVVALGVGVMFTLAVFLIQNGLLAQIRTSAPPGTPNVFLLDIPGPARQAVAEVIRRQPGVEQAPDVTGAVAARITAVDGTPIDQLPLRDWGRRFLRTRSVTEMADKPADMQILSGAWWAAGDHTPQVAVTDEAAHILNLKAGSTVDWMIWNHAIRTRIAAIQRTESLRMAARFEFIFNPGQLDNLPAVYYGSARVRPAAVAPLQRVLYQQFPTVTVINMADVMQTVEGVVDRISMVVRFISAFTILAGAIMVASSVAGSRFRRMREVVILKTLGATRGRIAGIFSVEFLVLGAVAGLMGSLLASGFAALILKFLMEINPRFDLITTCVTMLLAALIAAAAGWAASFRILGRKPLEILREE
ncbi:MAG TPA: FtsX-like permease family protein [Bryobacteraceae bacterium]|jgi:putative ABC transport system permease protein|nr:FtsX-like permease family protein [Bryobacteraceae bacterium]